MRIRRPAAACLAPAAAVTVPAFAGSSVPPQPMTPQTAEPAFQPSRSVSGDGSRLYFATAEKLVEADGDSAFDVYERAATPIVTPPPLKASDVLALPSTRRCVSRRKFRITLRRPSGTKIIRVVVTINGRRRKTVTRQTATVDLRGLPKGRVIVKIEVRTADGRTVRQTPRYRTCAPRRRG